MVLRTHSNSDLQNFEINIKLSEIKKMDSLACLTYGKFLRLFFVGGEERNNFFLIQDATQKFGEFNVQK